MRIDILQLPPMLPTTLDPQVRNYFTVLTSNLQFFADQVEQAVNNLEVVVGVTGREAASDPSIEQQLAGLVRTVQQIADRVTKLEAP